MLDSNKTTIPKKIISNIVDEEWALHSEFAYELPVLNAMEVVGDWTDRNEIHNSGFWIIIDFAFIGVL